MGKTIDEMANAYCQGDSFEDICMEKPAYIAGYHQAEKDLELTWKDMRELYIIFAEVDTEIELCKVDLLAETIGYYKEVLKRFKERKKKWRYILQHQSTGARRIR